MKKTALLTAALVVLATAASAASIKNSKHDLSKGSTATIKSATTTEICVFCHTPHNPAQNVPLWNRTNPTETGWTMYASPTLTASATAKLSGGSFDEDSISLFCMSCHDGVTALGAMHNEPVDGADGTVALAGAGNLGGAGGKILSNDHPVGFDYAAAKAQDAGLVDKVAANTALGGGAFFGGPLSSSPGNMIECASCHKVHDPANAPFLRIANTGSALCLACHNK